MTRPPRWLAGFAAVEAEPGEEVEVDVALGPRALAHWDVGGGRVRGRARHVRARRRALERRPAAQRAADDGLSACAERFAGRRNVPGLRWSA